MKLFDEIERTDASPAGHQEDIYSFVNRVDQPYWERIRQELERWYADYPDEQRGHDLRNRFRRPEPPQHFGAWWELCLHRMFRRLNFRVEVEPDVPGGKPDFRMHGLDETFLVEATTCFSGIVDETRDTTREAAILSAVDLAHNPNFSVYLQIDRLGNQQPKVREIVEPLERWLAGLNPDAVLSSDRFDLPQCSLEVRGWHLSFTAFALRPESRGKPDHRVLGMGPGLSGFVNDREQLERALTGKRRKYRPDEPLMVAVLQLSSGSVDNEDIESALFGPLVYPVDAEGTGLGQLHWQQEGFWIRRGQPRGTRISAVLHANNVVPETVAERWPRLWPNPWAVRPIQSAMPFPRAVADQHRRVAFEDAGPHTIFGLAPDWPGPGSPFTKPWSTHPAGD